MIDKTLFENMLPDELQTFMDFLKSILTDISSKSSTTTKLANRQKVNHCCPYCFSSYIVKDGHSKSGVQRYRCKDCKKRFNDATDTLCSNSKLSYEVWLHFFECMIDKLSLRKTAVKLNINKNTAFAMRHKVLNALKIFREKIVLSGKIQADELYKSINLKGTRPKNMPRFSKPRQTKGGSKRGISDHQVCIASATDEWDNIYFEIVGVGPITTEMIEKTFSTVIKPGSTLITDCKSSYEKFAYNHNLKLQQVKSGTYQNLAGYNLAEINGLHSNVENFLQSFVGVSTKHLQGYLDWFSYQKYLTYTVELLKQPQVMMNYVIGQIASINIADIYSKDFPVDICDAYSHYHFSPSPDI